MELTNDERLADENEMKVRCDLRVAHARQHIGTLVAHPSCDLTDLIAVATVIRSTLRHVWGATRRDVSVKVDRGRKGELPVIWVWIDHERVRSPYVRNEIEQAMVCVEAAQFAARRGANLRTNRGAMIEIGRTYRNPW